MNYLIAIVMFVMAVDDFLVYNQTGNRRSLVFCIITSLIFLLDVGAILNWSI